MPHFILMMSPDESIGIFRQATPLTPRSQEKFLLLRALPPLHRLHEDKKNKLSIGMSFSKKGGWGVAAHLRGMRPTFTSQKDTLMLRRNTNIINFQLDLNYNYIVYFNCCAYIWIRINNSAHIFGNVFIWNQIDPDWDGSATEQTSIHRVLLT